MSTAKPLVIAHRGFSASAPEGTMLAFKKAREIGADGIELDVRLSKDNEIVVMHDDRVNRTTNGTGLVKDHTLAELKALDAGSWFSEHTAGERIATFKEACELMADWGGLLNVHLGLMRMTEVPFEKMVLELIYAYGIGKQVILSSFDHESLKRCKALAPEISAAPLLAYEIMYEPWNYSKILGATGMHPTYRTIIKETVVNSHAAGIAVRPWTVDDPQDLQNMIDYGVDAIITNRPDTLLQLSGR
jgi:glycerophosphoryl diester phosphodiesterase